MLRSLALLAATPAAATGALPSYPSRAVRIVAGFPAGGPLDLVARTIAPWLASSFGQPFLVENLVGDSGNLATAKVAAATPDGYNLLLCGPVNVINPLLRKTMADFDAQIAPVAGIASVPLVIEVHPSVAARSLPELIAYARAQPGKLNIAYAGRGTPQHIAIASFLKMSGVDFTLVPYAGSTAALADLLSGRVQVMFDPLPSSIQHLRDGRLIPLAVTTREAVAALPGIASAGAFLPGYEATSWFGIGAPRGTPDEIVGKLNDAVNQAFADPQTMARLTDLGATPMPGSPQRFARFIALETDRYRRIIRSAKITVDQ